MRKDHYSMLFGGDVDFLEKIVQDIDGQILEIGTNLGDSASIMAENTKARIDTLELDENNARRAKENLSQYPNVTVHHADSRTFKWDKPLDMLWIDGDHTNKGVKNDIVRFAKFVKSGGIICGHDYTGSECTVFEVVDELIKNNPEWEDFHIESIHIWVARKK